MSDKKCNGEGCGIGFNSLADRAKVRELENHWVGCDFKWLEEGIEKNCPYWGHANV